MFYSIYIKYKVRLYIWASSSSGKPKITVDGTCGWPTTLTGSWERIQVSLTLKTLLCGDETKTHPAERERNIRWWICGQHTWTALSNVQGGDSAADLSVHPWLAHGNPTTAPSTGLLRIYFVIHLFIFRLRQQTCICSYFLSFLPKRLNVWRTLGRLWNEKLFYSLPNCSMLVFNKCKRFNQIVSFQLVYCVS